MDRWGQQREGTGVRSGAPGGVQVTQRFASIGRGCIFFQGQVAPEGLRLQNPGRSGRRQLLSQLRRACDRLVSFSVNAV